MNKEQFEGVQNEFKGKVKEKWGKLTDNDVTQINGKYDQFVGSLQKRYGYAKEEADREVSNLKHQKEKNNHLTQTLEVFTVR